MLCLDRKVLNVMFLLPSLYLAWSDYHGGILG